MTNFGINGIEVNIGMQDYDAFRCLQRPNVPADLQMPRCGARITPLRLGIWDTANRNSHERRIKTADKEVCYPRPRVECRPPAGGGCSTPTGKSFMRRARPLSTADERVGKNRKRNS